MSESRCRQGKDVYLGENVELEIGVKGSEDGREGIRRRCVEEEEDGGGHGSKQAAKDHGDRGTLCKVGRCSPGQLSSRLPPPLWSLHMSFLLLHKCDPHPKPTPFQPAALSFSFNFLLGFSSNLMSPYKPPQPPRVDCSAFPQPPSPMLLLLNIFDNCNHLEDRLI